MFDPNLLYVHFEKCDERLKTRSLPAPLFAADIPLSFLVRYK